MAERSPRVTVYTPQGPAGRVEREGDFLFQFDPRASVSSAPSLAMPFRAAPYRHPSLHPVFQMNLPEGFVLEQVRNRLAKTTGMDPLLLLAVLGSQSPIGRLRFTLDGAAPDSTPTHGESLAELLAGRGSRELFARLVDTYVLRSGLSGVQPKVLVPERPTEPMHPEFKAAVATPELIVKSGLGEFPGLALNEYVCMTIVRNAGVPVPEFHLSDDGELLVVRRFDRPEDGAVLGFEDMLVLAGREAVRKYEGSYEQVLKLLRFYCAPQHLPAAREQLFDMVALSCILGNGDAHMKNFGVLYHSILGAVRMAPAYDIVCTRLYIRDDTLALDLAGNRSFFAARQGLLDFGARCDLPKARIAARVVQLADVALATLDELAPTVARLPGLHDVIAQEARAYRAVFAR